MSKEINDKIALAFKARAEMLGYKGKKRDDAALDYITGAMVGLYLAGKPVEADHLGVVAAMVIAPRGFREVERMAEDANETMDMMFQRFTLEHAAAVREAEEPREFSPG